MTESASVEQWEDVFAEGKTPAIDDLSKAPALARREPGVEGAPEAGEGEGEAEAAGGESEEEVETEQHLRFKVPEPRSKVMLGKDGEYGGILADTAEYFASVAGEESLTWSDVHTFLGAKKNLYATAGFDKGGGEHPVEGYANNVEKKHVAAAEKTVKALEIISATLNLLSPAYFSNFQSARAVIIFALKELSSLIGFAKSLTALGGDEGGTVAIFGDKEVLAAANSNVALAAGWGLSAFAGKLAEVMGGISAGVTGGLFADLRAGYSAEVLGFYAAEVIGGFEATLASRYGTAEVLGKKIEIGTTNNIAQQKNTEEVHINAKNALHVHGGHVKMTLADHDATLVSHELLQTGGDQVAIASKGAMLFMTDSDAVLIGKSAPDEPLDEALTAAKTAHDTAVAAAQTARVAAIGNLAASATSSLAEMLAWNTYNIAVSTAHRTFKAACAALAAIPATPQVKVTATKVTAAAGTTKVELDAAGTVTVTQAPGIEMKLSAGKLSVTAPLGLEVSAGPNTYTFGPAGYQGPSCVEA